MVTAMEKPVFGHSPQELRLWGLFAPTVVELGLVLVRVRVVQRGAQVLEILLQRADVTNGGITLDECAEASRRLARLLDVHDPLAGAYTLEVSSPGVPAPLTQATAIMQAVGQDVKAHLEVPLAGKRKVQGVLVSFTGSDLTIGADVVPLRQVKELVLVNQE